MCIALHVYICLPLAKHTAIEHVNIVPFGAHFMCVCALCGYGFANPRAHKVARKNKNIIYNKPTQKKNSILPWHIRSP